MKLTDGSHSYVIRIDTRMLNRKIVGTAEKGDKGKQGLPIWTNCGILNARRRGTRASVHTAGKSEPRSDNPRLPGRDRSG
jgi:hypothetical protein